MKKNSLVNDLSCADLYALARYCFERYEYFNKLMKSAADKLPQTETRRDIIIGYADKKRYHWDLWMEFEDRIDKRLMTYHNELIQEEE